MKILFQATFIYSGIVDFTTGKDYPVISIDCSGGAFYFLVIDDKGNFRTQPARNFQYKTKLEKIL